MMAYSKIMTCASCLILGISILATSGFSQQAQAVELVDPTKPPSKLIKELEATKPQAPQPAGTTTPAGTTSVSGKPNQTQFDPNQASIRIVYTTGNSGKKTRGKKLKSKRYARHSYYQPRNFIVMDQNILRTGAKYNGLKIVKISSDKILIREGEVSKDNKSEQKPIIHTVNVLPNVQKHAKYYGRPVDVIVSQPQKPIRIAMNNNNNNNAHAQQGNNKPIQNQSAEVTNKINLPMNNKPEDNYKSIMGGLSK